MDLKVKLHEAGGSTNGPAVPSQIISENNASQFNVMESAIDTKNVTTSNLQNSTFQCPEWMEFYPRSAQYFCHLSKCRIMSRWKFVNPLDQTDHRGLFKQITSPLSNFFITGTQVNALTITPTKNVLSITNPPIPTAANGTFYQGATKPFSTLTTYPTSLVTPASTITQNDTYTTGIPSSLR